ncbi:MAG: hypothetical protein M1165_02595, partial [Candidatus Pacearchaeota archaeon]|nr:hypothetical protein [Candidatus Pacearchaeota archaeon]
KLMRLKQIRGIIYDMLDLRSYENPLSRISVGNKFEMNLINGRKNYLEEDSIVEFYKNKRKWLLNRVHKLGGKITDFEEAGIIVFGAKEKIRIKYKDKIFEGDAIYHGSGGVVLISRKINEK